MRYVVAGYVIVLSLLFFYAAQLVWRRRKLSRAVARIAASGEPTVPEPTVSEPTVAIGAERP
jgi:hypothetical protein